MLLKGQQKRLGLKTINLMNIEADGELFSSIFPLIITNKKVHVLRHHCRFWSIDLCLDYTK